MGRLSTPKGNDGRGSRIGTQGRGDQGNRPPARLGENDGAIEILAEEAFRVTRARAARVLFEAVVWTYSEIE
jgi:hypothetical protein